MENEPMNFLEFYQLTEAVVLNTEKHYNKLLESVGDETTSKTRLNNDTQYEVY